MIKRHVEYAIIGAGTAGLGAYSRISRHSDSVVMIQDGPYGTTCARVGCMPSKLLITASDYAHHAETGGFFGVTATHSVSGQRVFERLRDERDNKFVARNLSYVAKIPAHHKMEGRAQFVAPGHLKVGDKAEIFAEKVILAVGSRPYIPAVFDPVSTYIHTSDTIFEIDNLPQSIAVIGLGVIGLELGQAMHRLGVKTTLFGRSGNVGTLTHPSLKSLATELFASDVPMYPAGSVERTWVDNGAWMAYRTAEGELVEEVFDMILVASGRVSNIDKMNLPAAGISVDTIRDAHDPHTLRYADHPVFVAGDATDSLPLWHEAFDEGRHAAENAMQFPHANKAKRRTPLFICFTDPQMALVGLSYEELLHRNIVVGDLPFEASPRHVVWNKTQGRMHVYLEAETGEILGSEILGHHAEHLAHILALAITHKMTAAQVLEMPIYHPSAEELLRDVLESAERKRQSKLTRRK